VSLADEKKKEKFVKAVHKTLTKATAANAPKATNVRAYHSLPCHGSALESCAASCLRKVAIKSGHVSLYKKISYPEQMHRKFCAYLLRSVMWLGKPLVTKAVLEQG
jgi:hypothetical protein